MRRALAPGYILQTRPYTESSLLLEVFTREHGCLSLLAKGVRRMKSPLRAALLPHRPLLLGWGRGRLPVLTAAETSAPLGDWRALDWVCACYLNELIMGFLPRADPHAALYDAYAETLTRLRDTTTHAALRIFEKRLLEEIGFGLLLDKEANGGAAIDPLADYRYQLLQGPLPSTSTAEGLAISGRSLLGLHHENLPDAQALAEARMLTTWAINYRWPRRTLRSREVLQSLYRYAPDGAFISPKRNG